MYVPWYIVPAGLFFIAILFVIVGFVKRIGQPQFVGELIPFPNMIGLGHYIAGILFILLGLAFVAGHYIK